MPNFFSTRIFLVLLGFILLTSSVILWENQESNNLSQLILQTESTALSLSSEMEIRYRGIHNALNRLANEGIPSNVEDVDKWEKDTTFYIGSFYGLKSIAWVDRNLFIQTIVPINGNEANIGQKASDIILSPSDVNSWIPVYNGIEFEGFIVGTINIDALVSPLYESINKDYILQISNEGTTVFTSGNWKTPKEAFVSNQTITWQTAAVFSLSLAPTDEYLDEVIADAGKTLIFGLSFSFIAILAVYFAQKYHALSRLNESRFRKLLEDVQLVAIIRDTSGRITFCNDYLLNLTGWKREEVMGHDWIAQFVPPEWKGGEATFLPTMPGGSMPAQHVNPILTRAGEQRWMMFSNTLLRDTRGTIIGTASLGEDITERRKAEEEVSTLNERLRHLITAIQELSSARALESVQRIIALSAKQLTGADGAAIAFRDGDFCYYADEEAIAPLWKGRKFLLTGSICGWVMLNKTPAAIPDIYADGRIPVDIFRPTFVKSLAMIPVNAMDPCAAIGAFWSDKHIPSEIEMQLLQTLADAAARAIENVRLLGMLEQRVAERTAQLEAANKELEAFAYSVSHDLRAPLRAMDGFSDALLSSYASQLDEQGRHYLDRIQQASRRMGQLISDLLNLSRITRSELTRQQINLGEVAREIASELKARDPHRQAEFIIPGQLTVAGDAHLLRIVLQNLLENAWKFSGTRQKAVVEVGRMTLDDLKSRSAAGAGHLPPAELADPRADIYYVRDNGVGFDMAYAGKLFAPFQRLHSMQEFPGTGIGLATVQRAIARHSGHIWPSAQAGQGATFYFTLGDQWSKN